MGRADLGTTPVLRLGLCAVLALATPGCLGRALVGERETQEDDTRVKGNCMPVNPEVCDDPGGRTRPATPTPVSDEPPHLRACGDDDTPLSLPELAPGDRVEGLSFGCGVLRVTLPEAIDDGDPLTSNAVTFYRASFNGTRIVVEGQAGSALRMEGLHADEVTLRLLGDVSVEIVDGVLRDVHASGEGQALELAFEHSTLIAPHLAFGLGSLVLLSDSIVEDGVLSAADLELTQATVERSLVAGVQLRVDTASSRQTRFEMSRGLIQASMLVQSDVARCDSLQMNECDVRGGLLSGCDAEPIKIVRSSINEATLSGGVDAVGSTFGSPLFVGDGAGRRADGAGLAFSFSHGSYVDRALFCGQVPLFASASSFYCPSCDGRARVEACFGDDIDLRSVECEWSPNRACAQ